MRFLGILLVLAGIANSGEYVQFASGSRMRVDGHEAQGSRVRLRIGEDWMEVDSAQIQGFEVEEYIAPVPAPMLAQPAPAPAPAGRRLPPRLRSVRKVRPSR